MNPPSVKLAERAALAPDFRSLDRATRRKLARRVGKSGCNGIGGRNGTAQDRDASYHGPQRVSKTAAHHSSEYGRDVKGDRVFLYNKEQRRKACAARRAALKPTPDLAAQFPQEFTA